MTMQDKNTIEVIATLFFRKKNHWQRSNNDLQKLKFISWSIHPK